MIRKTAFIVLCLLGTSCTSTFAQEKTSTSQSVRIAWNYSSMQKIADRGGYPRLIRLKDQSVITVYETRTGDIAYKRSHDNGVSWSLPVVVFGQFSYSNLSGETTLVNMANPEIKQLQNGDLIIACNYRPTKAEIAPYSIVVRRSRDNGKTWLPAQKLYNAAPRFTDGCWEPSFLQLPDGELQVYFANENPYQQTSEQEISMLSSTDNGTTWIKTPKTVSFRKDRRDGMPVPIVLGDEIVVVIEDNNIHAFKPYTIRTKLADNWNAPVWGDSPNRDYALATHVQDSIYMGAPYIINLPNGQTAISYQTTESRSSDWELSTMEVAVGNQDAHNFIYRTRPFDLSVDKQAKWNSLAMWNEDTVVALASANVDGKDIAPWMIKGYLIPETYVVKNSLSTYPIFIGAKGKTNAHIGMAKNKQTIDIVCKVIDSSSADADGVSLYFATNKAKYKIMGNRGGDVSVWQDKKGKWLPVSSDKIILEASVSEAGYELHFSVPDRLFSGFDRKQLFANAMLSAYDDKTLQYEEAIVNTDLHNPNSWLRLDFENE